MRPERRAAFFAQGLASESDGHTASPQLHDPPRRPTTHVPEGSPYIECRADEGVIAFWGTEGDTANITVISRVVGAFTLECEAIPGRWARHAFWVPEGARVVSVAPLRLRRASV